MEALIPVIGALIFILPILFGFRIYKALVRAKDNQYKDEYRRRRRLEDEVDRDLYG